MDNTIQKRNHSLDIVRIVAVFAIVMIHCSAFFVEEYELYTSEFIFGNLFDSITRMGVPLFLMISGALFLDECKKVTINSILKKNVKTLAVITIIWSIIYSVVYNVIFPLITGATINTKDFVVAIINGHHHMWYLYMIIGLYLITPFLKKFVYKENKKMVLFFIIISFVVQFLLPMVNKVCLQYLGIDFIVEWIGKFHLEFFGGYITYFLIGWYIVHVGIKQKYIKCIIYSLGLISVMFIFFYTHFTGDYGNVYEYIGVPVFLYSVSIFLILNNIKFNFREKTAEKLTKLSKLTFGVYIIHLIFLTVFTKLVPYRNHCVLYIIMSAVIVTCSSFLCSYIISKIPIIKKLVKA